ncbi:MAG: AGE family epimerase/isomerase, partial [Cyclobacteriaceae bacterium]|nr:AGE family epimerase/isomerase [Cyclobacteriaceae bacterium]
HSIKTGWDEKNGGLFNGGYYFKGSEEIEIVLPGKDWWPQSEAMNALLLFSNHYPNEYYREYFYKQWDYVDQYFIDHAHGGWYSAGLDAHPEANREKKAHIWKTSYHTARALFNALNWLE